MPHSICQRILSFPFPTQQQAAKSLLNTLSALGMQRNDISSANGSCRQVTQGKGGRTILATVQNIKVFEIILVWLYKPWDWWDGTKRCPSSLNPRKKYLETDSHSLSLIFPHLRETEAKNSSGSYSKLFLGFKLRLMPLMSKLWQQLAWCLVPGPEECL